MCMLLCRRPVGVALLCDEFAHCACCSVVVVVRRCVDVRCVRMVKNDLGHTA